MTWERLLKTYLREETSLKQEKYSWEKIQSFFEISFLLKKKGKTKRKKEMQKWKVII